MARYFTRADSEFLGLDLAVLTSTPISMSCWFHPVQANDDVNFCLQAIVAYAAEGSFHMLWAVGTHSGADQKVWATTYEKDVGSTQAITSATWTINAWNHACGVFAAANDRRVYLNGGNKGTNTVTRTPANLTHTSIGHLWRSENPAHKMDGPIGEVAVYNCALTDNDAMLLSKRRFSPLLVKPQNLAAYWSLRHGDNADWIGRYPMLPINTPTDTASPPIVYPERDDPVWGLVLPRYRPRRYWVVLKPPVGAIYGERGTLRGIGRGLARGI